ncbi:hypothetical protein [Methylobacter luteus]|nr:hypothetical protein [Methylobacter luteus]
MAKLNRTYVAVTDQRTATDWAHQIQHLVDRPDIKLQPICSST